MAVWKVAHGESAAHRRCMIRRYALAAAGITLRIYLGTAVALNLPFVIVSPIIARASWVPNVLIAELALRTAR